MPSVIENVTKTSSIKRGHTWQLCIPHSEHLESVDGCQQNTAYGALWFKKTLTLSKCTSYIQKYHTRHNTVSKFDTVWIS